MVDLVAIGLAFLTVVSGIVAGPTFFKYGLHYLYDPKIDIYIRGFDDGGEVHWDDIRSRGIKYHNKSDRVLIFRPVFAVDKNLDYSSDSMNQLYKTGVDPESAYITHIAREATGLIGPVNPDSRSSILFPFEKPDEDFTMVVMVYPYIQPAEFGLPRFLDPVDLKRIAKTYKVHVDD